MTTGWMVAPSSKHPFLNMKTPVLLMQVPAQSNNRGRGKARALPGNYNLHFYCCTHVTNVCTLKPLMDTLQTVV